MLEVTIGENFCTRKFYLKNLFFPKLGSAVHQNFIENHKFKGGKKQEEASKTIRQANFRYKAFSSLALSPETIGS